MPELVPIKVKICRGAAGKMVYPNFNALSSTIRQGMDWSHYFDRYGLGWHYDKLSGLGESDESHTEAVPGHEHENTDPDCMFGVTCVPADFADAAAAAFPSEVSVISEASFRTFYDDRAHILDETHRIDVQVLQGLKARLDLEADPNAPTVAPSQAILDLRAKMLDPTSERAGIRKNLHRTWSDFKALRGITIRAAEAE